MLTVLDPSVRQSPLPQSVPVGGAATFSASVAGTAPLTNQWRRNGVALPGKTTQSLFLSGVTAADAGVYDLASGNAFGSVTSAPAMLTVNTATLDSLAADANNIVCAMAVQGDGAVLVGGAFTGLGIYARNRLARVLPDGSIDTLYNPNANQDVYCLLQLPVGKLLVGGAFTTLGG